jgi:RNA polymerase sigma-70 factor (ECF subfamily)
MTFFLQFLLLFARNSVLDNQELAKRIKSGNHDAFKELYDALSPQLLSYLKRMGGESADSADVIQQAFIILWEKRSEIDEHRSIRAFLFKIASNRMLNVFRDRKKFIDTEFEPESTGSNPELIAAGELTLSHFNKAIAALPEKRRQVFELCFIQQFTYKEAAEVLGVTHKTIENHMLTALKNIREAMKKIL